MRPCRECHHPIAEQAFPCPQCGAPCPAKPVWDGWGYEYRSSMRLFGLPLVHIAFKYRTNRVPVVARGVLAISQFGVGLFSLSQCTIAGFAVAQIGCAYALLAQIGLFIHEGHGQLVVRLADLF